MTVVVAPASVVERAGGGERVDVVDAFGVKSDIRGLATAGRTVLLEWIAGLTSSVIRIAGQTNCP
jgi:3-phosphoglycerate kinase